MVFGISKSNLELHENGGEREGEVLAIKKGGGRSTNLVRTFFVTVKSGCRLLFTGVRISDKAGKFKVDILKLD